MFSSRASAGEILSYHAKAPSISFDSISLPSTGATYKGICLAEISLLKIVAVLFDVKLFFMLEYVFDNGGNNSEYLKTGDDPCVDVISSGRSFNVRNVFDSSVNEARISSVASSPVPRDANISFYK